MFRGYVLQGGQRHRGDVMVRWYDCARYIPSGDDRFRRSAQLWGDSSQMIQSEMAREDSVRVVEMEVVAERRQARGAVDVEVDEDGFTGRKRQEGGQAVVDLLAARRVDFDLSVDQELEIVEGGCVRLVGGDRSEE